MAGWLSASEQSAIEMASARGSTLPSPFQFDGLIDIRTSQGMGGVRSIIALRSSEALHAERWPRELEGTSAEDNVSEAHAVKRNRICGSFTY